MEKDLLITIIDKAIKYDELHDVITRTNEVLTRNIDKVPTVLIFVMNELTKILNKEDN